MTAPMPLVSTEDWAARGAAVVRRAVVGSRR
jgi:hypothetical protein